MNRLIDRLIDLQAKLRRWRMWNTDEAIVISSATNRTWMVYVENHPACGTDDPPTEHIAAYEINRSTGEPLHEPDSIFDMPDDFQKQFEQGRIEPHTHTIDPHDRGHANG